MKRSRYTEEQIIGILKQHQASRRSTCSSTSRYAIQMTRCYRCPTPHIGYVTREEPEIQFSEIFDQIIAFRDGSPINVINPEVL